MSAETRAAIDQPGVEGAVVWYDSSMDENLKVRVFGSASHYKTLEAAMRGLDSVTWIWTREPVTAGPVRVRPGSRTAQAVALVQQEGKTPHAAAAALGINASAVYRALQRRETPPCPRCGRPM